ncbi:unnamed protein product [Closterium sp. NIES-54]
MARLRGTHLVHLQAPRSAAEGAAPAADTAAVLLLLLRLLCCCCYCVYSAAAATASTLLLLLLPLRGSRLAPPAAVLVVLLLAAAGGVRGGSGGNAAAGSRKLVAGGSGNNAALAELVKDNPHASAEGKALVVKDSAPSSASRDAAEAEAQIPPLQLIIAEEGRAEGAVCLDGSAPGFYYRKGYGSGRNNWPVLSIRGGLVFTRLPSLLPRVCKPLPFSPPLAPFPSPSPSASLPPRPPLPPMMRQGGAWCASPESCVRRAASRLGSTDLRPSAAEMEAARSDNKNGSMNGMLSPNRTVNPGEDKSLLHRTAPHRTLDAHTGSMNNMLSPSTTGDTGSDNKNGMLSPNHTVNPGCLLSRLGSHLTGDTRSNNPGEAASGSHLTGDTRSNNPGEAASGSHLTGDTRSNNPGEAASGSHLTGDTLSNNPGEAASGSHLTGDTRSNNPGEAASTAMNLPREAFCSVNPGCLERCILPRLPTPPHASPRLPTPPHASPCLPMSPQLERRLPHLLRWQFLSRLKCL